MNLIKIIFLLCMSLLFLACSESSIEITKYKNDSGGKESTSPEDVLEENLLDAISSVSVNLESGEIGLFVNRQTSEMRFVNIDDIANRQFTVTLFDIHEDGLRKIEKLEYLDSFNVRVDGFLGHTVRFGIRNLEGIGYIGLDPFSYDLLLTKIPKSKVKKFINGDYEPVKWFSTTSEEKLSKAVKEFLENL
ncbi:MAG: hypothetical protein LAT55_10570 [Opitutales bacterium]|nr:hypothetical protein [Opitutales bacterium]